MIENSHPKVFTFHWHCVSQHSFIRYPTTKKYPSPIKSWQWSKKLSM